MIRCLTSLLLSCELVLVPVLALAGGPAPMAAHAAAFGDAPTDAPCAMAMLDIGAEHIATTCKMPTYGCLACGPVAVIMDRAANASLRADTPRPVMPPSGDPLSGAAPGQDPPPPRV